MPFCQCVEATPATAFAVWKNPMKSVHYAIIVALSFSAGFVYDNLRQTEHLDVPAHGHLSQSWKNEPNRDAQVAVSPASAMPTVASYTQETLPELSAPGAPPHETTNPDEEPDKVQQRQGEMGSQLKSLQELEASMRENHLPPEHIRQIIDAQKSIAEQSKRLAQPRQPVADTPPPSRETFVAELTQAGIPQRDIKAMANAMFQPVPESAKAQTMDAPAKPVHEEHQGE